LAAASRSNAHGADARGKIFAAKPRLRCGATFECRPGGGCWCAAEPYLLPMTNAAIEDCLCPACLRKAADAQS
jgi:hypothetical protein